jgi:hypothetical protein
MALSQGCFLCSTVSFFLLSFFRMPFLSSSSHLFRILASAFHDAGFSCVEACYGDDCARVVTRPTAVEITAQIPTRHLLGEYLRAGGLEAVHAITERALLSYTSEQRREDGWRGTYAQATGEAAAAGIAAAGAAEEEGPGPSQALTRAQAGENASGSPVRAARLIGDRHRLFGTDTA